MCWPPGWDVSVPHPRGQEMGCTEIQELLNEAACPAVVGADMLGVLGLWCHPPLQPLPALLGAKGSSWPHPRARGGLVAALLLRTRSQFWEGRGKVPGECWLLTGSKVRFGTAPGLEGDSVLLLFALGPRDEMESGSLK